MTLSLILCCLLHRLTNLLNNLLNYYRLSLSNSSILWLGVLSTSINILFISSSLLLLLLGLFLLLLLLLRLNNSSKSGGSLLLWLFLFLIINYTLLLLTLLLFLLSFGLVLSAFLRFGLHFPCLWFVFVLVLLVCHFMYVCNSYSFINNKLDLIWFSPLIIYFNKY